MASRCRAVRLHSFSLLASYIAFSIAAAPALTAPRTATSAQDSASPAALETEVERWFDQKDYARALDAIEQHLTRSPRDAGMLYNAACACARLQDRDRAASYLFRAVECGFRGFDHMRRDPDLDPIRDHPTYEAILEATERLAARSADHAIAGWKRTFGEAGYRFERDDVRRLAFATALNETSLVEMRRMLEVEADYLIETLFEAPPTSYVLIAVPTPIHAAGLLDDPAIGGIYDHAQRRLVARDIGGTLRHEFVHAFHYGHMERLGQPHRLWVQEGLASLFEDYRVEPDGRFTFLPNERLNVAKRRGRGGLLLPWEDLINLPATRFMAQAGHLYPQVRTMFQFLAERGRLKAWYQAYVERFDADPSGRAAFESVFEQPLAEVERQWRRWLDDHMEVDTAILEGEAALGIVSRPHAANDGVAIEDILPGSTAARSDLRIGDVIVAADGRPTRSMNELVPIIAAKEVGDTVELRVRRGAGHLRIVLVLRPLRSR